MTTLAVLMPAFNEGAALATTLLSVKTMSAQTGGVTVYLVDDGGDPPVAASALPAPGEGFSIVLARHPVNLGQGAAIETARQLALRDAPRTAYVTMDADGQHASDDVLRLARAIEGGADAAFGNRFLGGSRVPRGRAALLGLARLFERAVVGRAPGDPHNGLRAFSRRALEAVRVRQNRMAHATEIKQRVRAQPGLVVVEVPVGVRYDERTLAKGQGAAGAADIVKDLAHAYFFGDAP